MALSERERQMLEEMEQAIQAEDPRFASQMDGGKTGLGTDRRRLAIGIVGALAGLGLVLLGVNTTIWVGVAGFVLIVASVALAMTPARSSKLGVVADDGTVNDPQVPRAGRAGTGAASTGAAGKTGASRKSPKSSGKGRKAPRQGTFMERMEQRWEERRRQGQGW